MSSRIFTILLLLMTSVSGDYTQTKQYLNSKGVTMTQAKDFVIDNHIDNISLIYQTCKEFGVTNDMLSDILEDSIPGITGTVVANYFATNGIDSTDLGGSIPTVVNIISLSGNYDRVIFYQNVAASTLLHAEHDLNKYSNFGTKMGRGHCSDLDGSYSSIRTTLNNDVAIVIYGNYENVEQQCREVDYTNANESMGEIRGNISATIYYDLELASEVETTQVFDPNATISHNGVSYGTVLSPYTGKVWLDRNLGASQVCTSYYDQQCYGDYYQWGRETDGHEKIDSEVTTVLATSLTNVGNKSIKPDSYPYDWTNIDTDGNSRSVNWAKIDGSSVCPVGYRTPTIDELLSETVTISSQYSFNENFLKLPSAGYIGNSTFNLGVSGKYWSMTTMDGTVQRDDTYQVYGKLVEINNNNMVFESIGALFSRNAIRCIQN